MNIFKKIGFAMSSVLALGLITLPLIPPTVIGAADQPQVSVSSAYPSLNGVAVTTFSYTVDLQLVGGTNVEYFNIDVKGPAQYTYSITDTSGGTNQLSSIKLDPADNTPTSVLVTATPNSTTPPTPENYTFTFEASASDLKNSVALQATVTYNYALTMQTPDGTLSTKLTANKDNIFTIQLVNSGTGDLTNISLKSSIVGSPSNWSVTFDPGFRSARSPEVRNEM